MRFKTAIAVSIGICFIFIAFSGCGESVPRDEEVAAVTRHIAENFIDELKTELMTALENTVADTVGAIYVCAEKAPELSARYSSLPGITVKRTSKRLRNPNNAPDEYELKTLEILEGDFQRGLGSFHLDDLLLVLHGHTHLAPARFWDH